MGVLRCDRFGCDSILCDRYSNKHGYICESCLDELARIGPDANIEDFMNSGKVHPDYVTWFRNKLEEEFGLRD